jgi:hypothetical protein
MKTEPNPLHDALADLATTMSSNPNRLRQVRQRVERRRHRRMAAGAAVSAGAVAAAVGIAMVPREPRSTLQFNVAGSSLPDCASIAPPAPVKVPKDPVQFNEANGLVRYKGMAAVIAVGPGTLTLGSFSEAGVLPSADSVVVVVDSATTFENNGLAATAADVQVGQRVAFASSINGDGSHHLDHIELGVALVPPDAPKESDATDLKKAGVAPADRAPAAPSDGVLRGKDVLAAAAVDDVIMVTAPMGEAPVRVRLVLDSATQYFRQDSACANPALVAGTVLMYAAVPNADGSYTATEIHIFD